MTPFEAGDYVHEGLDPDSEGGDDGGGVGGAFVEGFGVALDEGIKISSQGRYIGEGE